MDSIFNKDKEKVEKILSKFYLNLEYIVFFYLNYLFDLGLFFSEPFLYIISLISLIQNLMLFFLHQILNFLGEGSIFLLNYKYKLMRIKLFFRDLVNSFKYPNCPIKAAQTIYVKPSEINCILENNLGRSMTGSILEGDWDLKTLPLETNVKYRLCKEHFIDKKAWKDIGIFEYMMDIIKNSKKGKIDNCRTLVDIYERYSKLDRLYDFLRKGGDFLSMKKLKRFNFREHGGIYVHIGRNGQVIFGLGGIHRLSILKSLTEMNSKKIPMQLGIVHREALNIFRDLDIH